MAAELALDADLLSGEVTEPGSADNDNVEQDAEPELSLEMALLEEIADELSKSESVASIDNTGGQAQNRSLDRLKGRQSGRH